MAERSDVRVSVVMATYNGARHVEEQLRSILDQLHADDEVVVVDDASTDDTLAVLARVDDPRVRVLPMPVNRGYVRTFGTALGEARGEVVLLSDQDDVWLPGHRDLLVDALRDHLVVASNLVVLGTGEPLDSPFGRPGWRLRAADSDRRWANVAGVVAGLRPYYGCAMGVRREALDVALPFPDLLTESHDLWLALLGNLAGSLRHVEEPTLQRRVHDANATPDRPRGIRPALESRVMLLRAVRELRRRLRTTPPDRPRA